MFLIFFMPSAKNLLSKDNFVLIPQALFLVLKFECNLFRFKFGNIFHSK